MICKPRNANAVTCLFAAVLMWTAIFESRPLAAQAGMPAARPAAWLHAQTDAPMLWTTLPALSPRERWQVHAFHFPRPGDIECQPQGGGETLTHLRLSVQLLHADDKSKPGKGDEPPQWVRADSLRNGGSARIAVQVHDRLQNRTATVVEKTVEGFYLERTIDVSLPFALTPGHCVLLVEVTPGDDTQALVYRLAPYERKEHPRRVLLISLDTHALQRMSLAGPQSFDTSPALTRLIEQEPRTRLYTGGVAVSSWTLPSHATIFSGLYPTQHGLIDGESILAFSEQVRILPELLQDVNVATYHLVSHTRVGHDFGYHRGVDVYGRYKERLGRRGRRVLHDSVELLKRERGRDVFMFLHLFDAHLPYTNYPTGYESYYQGVPPQSPDELIHSGLYSRKIYRAAGWRPDRRRQNQLRFQQQFAETIDAARSAYMLGIRDVDNMLASLFQRLKKAGLWENTSILITSDHGEEFFEHGLMTHTSLYGQNLAVPFILKLAANAPGTESMQGDTRRVPYTFEAHTTAFHTVLDLFLAPRPRHLEGVQTGGLGLMELLRLDRHHPAFAEYYVTPTAKYHEACLVTEDHRKLIYSTVLERPGEWQQRDVFTQLFDLSMDPAEEQNLFDELDPVHQRLRDQVIEKARQIRTSRFVPTVQGQLTPSQLERLEALGYIR